MKSIAGVLCLAALGAASAAPSLADCAQVPLGPAPAGFAATPPAPPDPGLRPVRPACLTGLASPEQENCPRDVIAAFGASVDAWVAALNAYVDATQRYANEAARFANAAVDHARGARAHADGALDFARCEAAAIAVPEAR